MRGVRFCANRIAVADRTECPSQGRESDYDGHTEAGIFAAATPQSGAEVLDFKRA
jgi:hypothetical protein